MKLTDEKVARVLGWVKKYGPKTGTRRDKLAWFERGEGNTYEYSADAPAFTTSLDAIVAEIEARGLRWNKSQPWNWGDHEVAQVFSKASGKDQAFATGRGKTPPLALCAALLAFLKEQQ